MPSQPLQPFAPPAFLGTTLGDQFASQYGVTKWIILFVLLFWTIYTIVAIYHWFKYSHGSWLAVPAIALHLFVSFVLIAYAVSGALLV